VADHADLHRRTRERGANLIVYWLVRALLQPFFHLYWRLSRVGREHVPQAGPVIFAANHRSFLDPFLIGTLVRRPMYFVAKRELFSRPLVAWLLSALGAFPVDRGAADGDAIDTAKEILARGDCVVIFPEGTRVRPGPLGAPRRGVGRLALESGAPVVPVAVSGTESIRRGWLIRPHKARLRCGRPLTFPHVESASPQLAAAVTDRIWPCVMLQWEWLGGVPPLRRVAVIGAGAWGTSLAVAFDRAGIDVSLGCRTTTQADVLAASRENARYLPGVALPPSIDVRRASALELAERDVVVFAVPARELPGAVAAHADALAARTGVLVCSQGLVPPLGKRASTYVAERVGSRPVACLGGAADAADLLEHGASLVVAAADADLAQQLAQAFAAAGLDARRSDDVLGLELAGAAKNAAVLAAAAAAAAGPNAAGAAAGKVFAEVHAYAARLGARPETFTGLAGAGDLVATVLTAGSGSRRAGELLARGIAPGEIEPALGDVAEALDTMPLLAALLARDGVPAPTVDGLAAVVAGHVEPDEWTRALTAPARDRRPSRAA